VKSLAKMFLLTIISVKVLARALKCQKYFSEILMRYRKMSMKVLVKIFVKSRQTQGEIKKK
jgi:hypothetical protein